jgi:hypothetical protein
MKKNEYLKKKIHLLLVKTIIAEAINVCQWRAR